MAALFVLLAFAASPASAVDDRIAFGSSVDGRVLRAERVGPTGTDRTVLVVGSFHGDEIEGHEIVERLRDAHPADAEIWLVESLNPDGVAASARKNANGVDLNRNFPVDWAPSPETPSGYYPGPRPFSEPESRALRRLARRIEPDLAIFYHQPWDQVLGPCRADDRVQRQYAMLAGMEFACRGGELPGTATKWFNRVPGRRAFVVELPAGELSSAKAKRHARAVLAIAPSDRAPRGD
jgi:murein peptide amidase A